MNMRLLAGLLFAVSVVGFGLRDSIQTIVTRQFSTIWTYNAQVTLESGTDPDAAAKELLKNYDIDLYDLRDNSEGNNYFDGIQLFKKLRDPLDFYSERDTGKAFSTSDGIKSSTSYTLAQYYILRAEYDKAKPHLVGRELFKSGSHG